MVPDSITTNKACENLSLSRKRVDTEIGLRLVQVAEVVRSVPVLRTYCSFVEHTILRGLLVTPADSGLGTMVCSTHQLDHRASLYSSGGPEDPWSGEEMQAILNAMLNQISQKANHQTWRPVGAFHQNMFLLGPDSEEEKKGKQANTTMEYKYLLFVCNCCVCDLLWFRCQMVQMKLKYCVLQLDAGNSSAS